MLTLLESLPFGQIIPYYNDLKTMSIKKSNEFYNSSLLFSFVIGIGFFIFANIFITVITKLFAFHIDPERMLLFRQLLQIASFGFIFYPINQINEQLLNEIFDSLYVSLLTNIIHSNHSTNDDKLS